MVWSQDRFLSARIRMACPVLELFHTYKKLLEDRKKSSSFTLSLHHSDTTIARKQDLCKTEIERDRSRGNCARSHLARIQREVSFPPHMYNVDWENIGALKEHHPDLGFLPTNSK